MPLYSATTTESAGQGYFVGLPILSALTGIELIPFDTELPNGVSPQTARCASSLFLGSSAIPLVTGRFNGLPRGTTPASVLTVASTLYAYPIIVSNPAHLPILTFNINCLTGQTGGACHIGIYDDNGAGYPGALVYDTGAVAGLTSTVIVTNTPTAGPNLVSGLYWFATEFTASGTYPSVAGITANYATEVNALLGSDTAAHALAVSGEAVTGISVTNTYGALPLVFPASATLTVNADTPLFVVGC